jgi:putative transposase
MQVKINKAFKFRLELTEEQNERFRQSAGASRFAYNYALARKKTLYQETGKSITSGEIQKEITRMKQTPAYEWLNEIPSQIPQQSIQNLERAFDRFFKKRSGFPKFKQKHSWIQSLDTMTMASISSSTTNTGDLNAVNLRPLLSQANRRKNSWI